MEKKLEIFTKNGKYGVKENDQIIAEAIYDRIVQGYQGSIVSYNGYNGWVNVDGEIVIPPCINHSRNGVIKIKTNNELKQFDALADYDAILKSLVMLRLENLINDYKLSPSIDYHTDTKKLKKEVDDALNNLYVCFGYKISDSKSILEENIDRMKFVKRDEKFELINPEKLFEGHYISYYSNGSHVTIMVDEIVVFEMNNDVVKVGDSYFNPEQTSEIVRCAKQLYFANVNFAPSKLIELETFFYNLYQELFSKFCESKKQVKIK